MLVVNMAVHFLGDSQVTQRAFLRCLFCGLPFVEKRALNEHYLTAHVEAFSEEELSMARLGRAHLAEE